MKSRILLAGLLLTAGALTVQAQAPAKKILTHEVYDSWKSIEADSISHNGKYLLYAVNPQEGDGVLHLRELGLSTGKTFARGYRNAFTADSRFAVFQVKPSFAATRQAKLKKKKPEEMPKDSLAIHDLAKGSTYYVARVKSYKLPKENGEWVAYHLEAPLATKAAKDTSKTKTATPAPAAKAPAGRPAAGGSGKKEDGTELVLRHLPTGQEYRFDRVTDFLFSEKGNMLFFVKAEKDSLHKAGVFAFNTSARKVMPVDSGRVSYKNITTDKAGEQLAFVASKDSTGKDIRYFHLLHWTPKDNRARVVADTAYKGVPSKWMVSEHAQLGFSDKGDRLFFGTFPRPTQYEKDSTKLEEDKVSLDVWTYRDPLIQPMQLKQLEREQKRSFLALYDVKGKKIVQLATLEIPDVSLNPGRTADVAVGSSNVNYLLSVGYDTPSRQDAWLIDLKDGSRRLAVKDTRGTPRLSPAGKYLYWYEPSDSSWKAMSVKASSPVNLTKKLKVAFYDEQNDVPSLPDDYGLTGWTKDDQYLLVNDRYDLWRLDPAGKAAAVNITDGYGRQNNLQFRYVSLNPSLRTVPVDDRLLLRTLNLKTKDAGFYTDYVTKTGVPQKVLMEPYSFVSVRKAKDSDRLVFRKANFKEYSDLWVTNTAFATPQKISNANPQQSEYLWGSVELVDWRSDNGTPLEGLLFKPENFDPKKKYPMLVYFYERNAETLHNYRSPAPSASTINIPLFVSQGYLVFVPDIIYKDGYPGESAYHSIIPGVQSLVAKGFVDEKNMALQGQSWGGYQVAYLVTRTNMFKAAMAGAPVSNMTSAYGGIRWESGMSRQFQYERTQSRIGGTLWEKPMQYIENSPLFYVPKVETPLMMMANDNDGAVPWYQGIEMFMALRRLSKPVWLLVYNGEAHNLMQRKNRKDLSVRMSQFFDHYLKGAPEPAWMKKGVPTLVKGKEYGLELIEEPAKTTPTPGQQPTATPTATPTTMR
ncbi:alpha/beta hydrolase family protein [Rufibacter glacialis]|uniref:Alpha/beta hydrolase family protein n=1 Tax=Rufibacter glacialis TaxID=1259555 RepID=A0A5M8QEK4_9BACT|nr:prolyl oligopeptidase family serine peptidase [Rufibacter glacialis]KAA6433521.1 S9 family peptidase [Rufibacter glacialis]GGK73447.1 peptidase S9 [Rufibacter glacialis]